MMMMSEPGFALTRVNRIVAAIHEVDRAIDAWDGSDEATARLRRAMSVQDATQRIATRAEIDYAGMLLDHRAREKNLSPGYDPARPLAGLDAVRTDHAGWILWYRIRMQTIDKLQDKILRIKHRMTNCDPGI